MFGDSRMKIVYVCLACGHIQKSYGDCRKCGSGHTVKSQQ